MIFIVLGVLVIFICQVSGVVLPLSAGTVRMMGYGKAAITFVKYLPQVYLNWSRKSTVGWSIENVILDFTGGSFSLLQELIDSYTLGKDPFKGDGFNIVKFMLSIMSIFFDTVFMIQRYVLYPGASKKAEIAKKLGDGVSSPFTFRTKASATSRWRTPYDIQY